MNEISVQQIELSANKNIQENTKETSSFVKFYKSIKTNNKLVVTIDLFLCNFVRFFYVIESAFCIFYLINLTSNLVYLISVVPLLTIIADDLYVSIKRKGKEFYWYIL